MGEWLCSDKCSKFIHDSRQDQDALYHLYGIELHGIFDTTIADLIRRVWVSKARGIGRLKGMDSLATDTIRNAKDYKVLFSLQTHRTGKYIKLEDLKKTNNGNKNKVNDKKNENGV